MHTNIWTSSRLFDYGLLVIDWLVNCLVFKIVEKQLQIGIVNWTFSFEPPNMLGFWISLPPVRNSCALPFYLCQLFWTHTHTRTHNASMLCMCTLKLTVSSIGLCVCACLCMRVSIEWVWTDASHFCIFNLTSFFLVWLVWLLFYCLGYYLQNGGGCDQSPVSVQMMLGSPTSVCPSLQLNVTKAPTVRRRWFKLVPPMRPFSGATGVEHWIAVSL